MNLHPSQNTIIVGGSRVRVIAVQLARGCAQSWVCMNSEVPEHQACLSNQYWGREPGVYTLQYTWTHSCNCSSFRYVLSYERSSLGCVCRKIVRRLWVYSSWKCSSVGFVCRTKSTVGWVRLPYHIISVIYRHQFLGKAAARIMSSSLTSSLSLSSFDMLY